MQLQLDILQCQPQNVQLHIGFLDVRAWLGAWC